MTKTILTLDKSSIHVTYNLCLIHDIIHVQNYLIIY
jgi:hypothetical protein